MFARKIALALALVLTMPAFGAVAQEIPVVLPGQDWQVITTLLQEAPYRVSASILEKMNRQFMMMQGQQRQQRPSEPTPSPSAPSAPSPSPSVPKAP